MKGRRKKIAVMEKIYRNVKLEKENKTVEKRLIGSRQVEK